MFDGFPNTTGSSPETMSHRESTYSSTFPLFVAFSFFSYSNKYFVTYTVVTLQSIISRKILYCAIVHSFVWLTKLLFSFPRFAHVLTHIEWIILWSLTNDKLTFVAWYQVKQCLFSTKFGIIKFRGRIQYTVCERCAYRSVNNGSTLRTNMCVCVYTVAKHPLHKCRC